MSADADPPRLADDAAATPASLRRALGAARAVAPSPEEIAALAARLPMAPGAGGGPTAALRSWGVAGAIGGVAIGVAALVAWRGSHPAPAVAASVPSGEPPSVVAPHVAPSLTAPPVDVASAAPPVASERRVVAAPRPSAAREEPLTESDLLERAYARARTDPAAALALVADHARRFPRGALSQEREVVAITALVAAGRRAEAEARAERFFTSYPRSAHRSRIDALLGQPKKHAVDQNSQGSSPPTP